MTTYPQQKLPYALIEAGGTKFVLGIAHGPNAIMATHRVPTTTPAETLAAVEAWFAQQAALYGGHPDHPYRGLGIASFGPIQLDRHATDWGYITRTTKPLWSNTNVAPRIAAAIGTTHIGWDTDVNGAILAESIWGAAKNCRSAIYVTIGTGVGGGAVIDGRILQGKSHPEMGHIRLPRHPDDVDAKGVLFPGVCPFHGDCLEGLASGPAIIARYGASLSDLTPDHIGRSIIAFYLAQMVCTLQSLFEPDRIILGGGVMGTAGLLEDIIGAAEHLGSAYFVGKPSDIVRMPGLGDRAGLLGALALAQQAEYSAE
jgi:fructokinase